MSDPIEVARDGAVATLTLNRPDKLNALDLEMAKALGVAVREIEADRAVRCLVLRGAGRGFQAGGDVARFHAELDNIRATMSELIGIYHEAVECLARMPKPVLASLHGAVAGAGLSLALNADLAIAADTTVFTLAYTNIGTSPDGGSSYFLPRLVGRRKAMEIALLSDRFDAAAAERLGLINWVVPEADLEAETAKLAARIAAGPTRAYAGVKDLLNRSFESELPKQLQAEQATFEACSETKDFAEGVTAFVEKRKPEFHGE
jgi:2-(1,2-epoxy-1,2-dihydrophenyl)acetyl-CoA isomerase